MHSIKGIEVAKLADEIVNIPGGCNISTAVIRGLLNPKDFKACKQNLASSSDGSQTIVPNSLPSPRQSL